MAQKNFYPIPYWLDEFIRQFIHASPFSNIRFAIGKQGDIHALREGERKATLRQLFGAIHTAITKAHPIDTFTLEMLKNKCKSLIFKAKHKKKSPLYIRKLFKIFAAEIELCWLEKKIQAKEYERFEFLTSKANDLNKEEIKEYLLLLGKFFNDNNEEHIQLAKKLVHFSYFLELLFSTSLETHDHTTVWKRIALALYKDGKLLESLAHITPCTPLPLWARDVTKDILKIEFVQPAVKKSLFSPPFTRMHIRLDLSHMEPQLPKGLAWQELSKNFEPQIIHDYKELLAEAGAEVFVERKMPYFIPQGTLEKMKSIEKNYAKERILQKMKSASKIAHMSD